jgi:pyruvate/2-oxoglutarate dehydrogenase complex dihydrolipoamide dehydrogenase (E3) component
VLAREGIEFRFGGEPQRVEPLAGDGVRVVLEGSGAAVEASHLLFATGRRPNTDDLGLAAAGLETDRHGMIPVDGELRTKVPGVWAIGDVNGRGAFTHTSYDDYQIVAANLFDGGSRTADTRIMTYAVFVDPPLARVGLSETEVRASGRDALIATMPMTRVDAQTKQIIGAAILGIEGDEALHTFIDIMTAGAPYPTLQYAMHIHPTISELVPTLLDGLKPLKPVK